MNLIVVGSFPSVFLPIVGNCRGLGRFGKGGSFLCCFVGGGRLWEITLKRAFFNGCSSELFELLDLCGD